MRLLNTTTIELEEFIGDNIPSYAILSHRWQGEEVTFQDLREGRGVNMTGYSKITGCCSQAKRDGWEYAWVDSCCIDKSSSAELSEAINSMFKWYEEAEVCYAYLSDVEVPSDFATSQWFTRGWTLQELLAPELLIFYDQKWTELGTKGSMWDEIETITGILYFTSIGNASVAQKMSWASKRTTTRVEDQAYCLMGLFDVNMPPLYGEGEKAFLRLQLEILRISSDETIFAWTTEPHPEKETGLLAWSAANFAQSSNLLNVLWYFSEKTPHSMTNKGLRFDAYLQHTAYHLPEWANEGNDYLMPLNCSTREDGGQLAILIREVEHGQYTRISSEKPVKLRQLQNVAQYSRLDPEFSVCYFKQGKADTKAPRYKFDVGLCEGTRSRYYIAGSIVAQPVLGSISAHFARNRVREDKFVSMELDLDNGVNETALVISHLNVTAPHTFALLFGTRDNRPTLNFVCREVDAVRGRVVWAKNTRWCMGKWSKSLLSGHVVSVMLKKNGRTNDCRNYMVDVSIQDGATTTWNDTWPDDLPWEWLTVERMTKKAVRSLSEGNV